MDYLENLRNQIKQREKTIQPDRPKLTYRQKLTNFMNNAQDAYTNLGKTRFDRQIKYYSTMADLEDNGIDLDSLAPNYTKIRNLMENEKQARADIGDREFEKTFSKYWNIVQKTKDVDKITKAVKLKKTSYGQDVLDYLPTSLDYTDDEEDQIRKIAKVEPKAFNAKAIHQAANKLREEERKNNEARGIYAEQTAVNPYDEIFADNAITKDQLIEDLKLINRKSGKLSPKEREIYQQQNQDFNKMVTGAPEYMQQTRQNEDFNKMVTGAASQNQQLGQKREPYYGIGNVDLNNLPIVIKDVNGKRIDPNSDVPYLTTASMIVDDPNGNGYVLIPGTNGERELTPEEATEQYLKTGKYLGKFKTIEEADWYSQNKVNAQNQTQGEIYDQEYEKIAQQEQYQQDLAYENERAARRKQFAAEIQSKTGRSIEDTVEQFQNITGEFDRTGMLNGTVDYNRLSDEQKQTYEQIKNADPELFIYSQEERERVYKDPGSAFWAGLRNGFMMGLDELGVREGEISPEEIKRLTLQGFPIGAIVSKKDGKYYVDSVAMENARMAAENPAAFIAGNIGGSIPSTVATGALGKGVAVAAGAGKLGARMAAGALPGAIRGFANSMAQGQDAGGVILNTVGGGLLGAGGQAASAGLENVVGGALQKATPIIQNAAANAAGSVAYSAVDILGRAGITAATGGQVNWTQELSQIPADIILDVVLGGKVDLPSKQKMDIVSKNIVDGKLDLDKVRTDFYATSDGLVSKTNPNDLLGLPAPKETAPQVKVDEVKNTVDVDSAEKRIQDINANLKTLDNFKKSDVVPPSAEELSSAKSNYLKAEEKYNKTKKLLGVSKKTGNARAISEAQEAVRKSRDGFLEAKASYDKLVDASIASDAQSEASALFEEKKNIANEIRKAKESANAIPPPPRMEKDKPDYSIAKGQREAPYTVTPGEMAARKAPVPAKDVNVPTAKTPKAPTGGIPPVPSFKPEAPTTTKKTSPKVTEMGSVADQLNKQTLNEKIGDTKLRDTIKKQLNIKEPLNEKFIKDLSDMESTYVKTDNKRQREVAKGFVDNNFEQAEKYIKESNVIQSPADAAIASEIIDRYRASGRADEALEMIRQTAVKFSKAGQQVQSAALWAKMTPEGTVKSVDAAITKANKNLSDKKKYSMSEEDSTLLMDTTDKINKMNAQELKDLFIEVAQKRNRKMGKATEAVLDAMVKTDDISALKDANYQNMTLAVTDKVPRTIGQKISTIQAFGHLLNPRTAARNILSNGVFKQQESISDISAVVFDWLMSKKTQQRTVAMPSAKNIIPGNKAGLDYAKKSMFEIQTGVNLDSGAGKYDLFTKETFPASQSKVLNKIERILGYELKTPDQFSKGSVEISEIRKQLGLQGKDVQGKSMSEILEMADDETLKIAKQQALYNTFQDDGLISGFLTGAKKLLNKFGINKGDFGVGDLILKYTKVPGNIIQRSIDYTPLGALKVIKYIGQKGLTRTQQRDIAKTFGRTITGTAMGTVGYLLTKAGVITSAPDNDDKERKFFENAGLTGRRINLSAVERIIAGKSPELQDGDRLVSFDFLETINVPLSMGHELAKADEVELPADKVLSNLGKTFGEEILDLPTMYIINKMVYEGMKDDSNIFNVLTVPLTEAIPGFVPSPIRQASVAFDDTQRESKTFIDKAIGNTPARTMLPEKLGTFGQPLKQDTGVLAFLNPGTSTTYSPLKFEKELKRLANEYKDYRIYPSGIPVKEFERNKKIFTLSENEQLEFSKAYGELLTDAYSNILESSLDDETKVKKLQAVQEYWKESLKDDYALKHRNDSKIPPVPKIK